MAAFGVVFVAAIYMALPLLGLIWLGMVRERRRNQALLRRSLVALRLSNVRRGRYR